MPATRHEDDDAVADPLAVWFRDGGVSPESPLPGCLLGVAVDVRFSEQEKSCIDDDAEEDIADGFEGFGRGPVCVQRDWLVE